MENNIIKTISLIYKHYETIEPEEKTALDKYQEHTWLTTLNSIKLNPSIYEQWFNEWRHSFIELI